MHGPVKVSPNFCVRRSVIMILNLSESLAKPLVMAKLSVAYTSKNAVVLLTGVIISGTPCPGSSLYHLVTKLTKHLRTTWSAPKKSHLLNS